MAYVIVSFNNEEVDRRALGRSLVIGRESSCTLCVRDIQLSRRHCQITETADGWFIQDLESRNGTFLNGRRVWKQRLEDGDCVRMGRTRLAFRAGAFEPAPVAAPVKRRKRRPSNPAELLGETLTEFDFSDPDHQISETAVYPRPRPVHPTAYETDGVYDMVETIASSSWDSILTENSRPVVMERRMPRPIVRKAGEEMPKPRQQVRRRSEADVSLQVRSEPTPTIPTRSAQVGRVAGMVNRVRNARLVQRIGRGAAPLAQRSKWFAAGMLWLAAIIFAVEGFVHR